MLSIQPLSSIRIIGEDYSSSFYFSSQLSISPQLTRSCYLATVAVAVSGASELLTTGMHTSSHTKHGFNSCKIKIKSRGHGGRKVGKRAQAEQQIRQKRLRCGELRCVSDLF